jgi:uncharacterized protein DUF2190
MPGQNQIGATLISMRAKVALTRGCAVITTANEDEVDLPAGTNSAAFMGYAVNDAAIGEPVAIHTVGGNPLAWAGGAIAIGDYLTTTGTAGKVAKLTLGASNQYVVGKALRAAADGDLFPVLPCNFIAQGA